MHVQDMAHLGGELWILGVYWNYNTHSPAELKQVVT